MNTQRALPDLSADSDERAAHPQILERCAASHSLIRPSENGASSSARLTPTACAANLLGPAEQWPLDEVFHSNQRAPALPLRAVDQDGDVLDILVQNRRRTDSGIRACRSLSSTKPVLCSCRSWKLFAGSEVAQHVEVEAEVYSATYAGKARLRVVRKKLSPSTRRRTNMFDSTRRRFLQQTGIGLATVGVSGVILHSDARPTQTVSQDQSERIMIQMGPTPRRKHDDESRPEEGTPKPYGPFYRIGAPFRGKLSFPGEPGTTFVLSGKVWRTNTKRPLPGAVLDFWHVDMEEKYSNGTTISATRKATVI